MDEERLIVESSPVDEVVEETVPLVDINAYQHKKTLAKGMLDLALLSANANQLRYVLETGSSHPYFYPSIVLISLSLLVQIAVGVLLILNSRYDINLGSDYMRKANRINNYTIIVILLITIINGFISAFSIANTHLIETTEIFVEHKNATVEREPFL